MRPGKAWKLMSRNLVRITSAACAARAVVDRFGRARGNWLGLPISCAGG
jgi:hypothetical protein